MTKRVLCFGDSNTWGWIPGSGGERLPADVRWPGVMAADLGADFTVVEEAQNGRTTMWDDPTEPICKNGLRHLPIILESQKPVDLVIVMLGTNDLKIHFHRDPDAIARCAAVVADRARQSDAGPAGGAPEVLLVAPAPVTDGHCPFGHLFDGAPAISAEFARAFADVANDFDFPFLNAGDHASCPVPDTIHIDAESHERLGKAMAAKVANLLS